MRERPEKYITTVRSTKCTTATAQVGQTCPVAPAVALDSQREHMSETTSTVMSVSVILPPTVNWMFWEQLSVNPYNLNETGDQAIFSASSSGTRFHH